MFYVCRDKFCEYWCYEYINKIPKLGLNEIVYYYNKDGEEISTKFYNQKKVDELIPLTLQILFDRKELYDLSMVNNKVYIKEFLEKGPVR